MQLNEKPVLQVENLTVRYGEGCPHCKESLEKTAVQYAEQYGRQTMFQLMFTLEKFWE